MGWRGTTGTLVLGGLVALVALVSASCRKRAPPAPVEDPPPPPVDTTPISQPRAFDGVADASVQGPSGTTAVIDFPPIDSNVPDGCSGRHVPLCLASLPTKCCTAAKPVTYASCTRATGMRWQCPAGKVLDTSCPRDPKRCDPQLISSLAEYAPHKKIPGTDLPFPVGFDASLSATSDLEGHGTGKSQLKYKDVVLTDRLYSAIGPPDGSAALYCENPFATFLFVTKTKKKVKISATECAYDTIWDLEDETVVAKLAKGPVTFSYR